MLRRLPGEDRRPYTFTMELPQRYSPERMARLGVRVTRSLLENIRPAWQA